MVRPPSSSLYPISGYSRGVSSFTKPFVKWVGGKTRLLKHYTPYFPVSFRRYVEPFVGGGAVFFHLLPKRALLGDANNELIQTYLAVRDSVEEVIELLNTYPNEENFFYSLRAITPQELSRVALAARFIYLNKSNFNGMYRLSRKTGNSNVPFGRHRGEFVCDVPTLRAASAALKGVTLRSASYEKTLRATRPGDFVYLDPPYDSVGYTHYSPSGFNADDQRRLAKEVHRLDILGCRVMLSNSDTPLIRELYAKFTFVPIITTRSISRKATSRGKKISELLIINYAPPIAR